MNSIGSLTQVYQAAQKQQTEVANIANGSATAAQDAQDKATLSPEARLAKTSAAFGESLQNLTPDQRKYVAGIYQKVGKEAEQAKKDGLPYDATAQFPLQVMNYASAGMFTNGGDKGLATTFNAGHQFLDAYTDQVKSQRQ